MMPARPQSRRGGEAGATLVEFVLVAPVLFLMLFGLIAGCYLAYQNAALHDGATAAARTASIQTNLVQQQTSPSSPDFGQYCESGKPFSIEKSVGQAAPLLKVNPAPLCATSASATQLTQNPQVPGDVNIVVTCGTSCAAPTSTEVSLVYRAKGLVPPFSFTYNLTAQSQVPVVSP